MATTRPRLADTAAQTFIDAKRPSLAKYEVPLSHHQRLAVMKLGVNPDLCFAAAIGLCWRSTGKPSARWTPADPAAYAEAVFDELIARPGVTYAEIIETGSGLWEQIQASLVTKEEEQEALGNSEAPPVASNG